MANLRINKLKIHEPRIPQLLIMASLLMIGVIWRDFSLKPWQIIGTFIAGLFTQSLAIYFFRLAKSSLFSAIITCFGICLLLRSSVNWIHPLIVIIAIGSKFLIRINGHHVFNPANFGVIIALSFFPNTWVASGQWGNEWIIGFWLLAGGFWVTTTAKRLDSSLYFLISYASLLLIIRIGYYGYSLASFWHQFTNGALLLFAFFMISDPMTIPHHSIARLLHTLIVAILAYIWQYVYYYPQGILWGLFWATPLVVLWNRLLPAPPYQWQPVKS
ncbi:MAG: hypothetical protein RL637_1191 [Pseudomonadota bacterium]|jgi:Na+-transporting NADH:ubiquinone oxidoreductase subunit NqrB